METDISLEREACHGHNLSSNCVKEEERERARRGINLVNKKKLRSVVSPIDCSWVELT